MYEDPKSKISQLQKVLDAREDFVSRNVKRHELHDKKSTISEDWDESEFKVGDEVFVPVIKPKRTSFSTKILIASIIFFVIALGVVFYEFLGGNNIVSGNNIEITVKAPISVSSGENVPIEIEIKNNNNVTLLASDLGIVFPVGAKEVSDISLPAKRIQSFLGDILPKQSIKKNVSAVFFGSENENKDISITLEYKITGSNSLFNKTKTVSILITSAPVSIVVNSPKEVNTNQSVDFTIDVTSNSSSVIKNLLLAIDYPFGFSFNNSNPKTFSKNNLWLIGDLSPGAKQTIKISGVLSGQEGEERGFRFNIGLQSKSDSLIIETPLTSSFSSITIRRPFVSADIFFNDVDTSEYISSAGSSINTLIKWQNNLPYEVSDVSIVVRLSGNVVDKSSIRVDNGFYQSIDNSIIFNKTTDKTLASLSPGESGNSQFIFSSFGAGSVTGSGLSNPTIVFNISVTGRRVDYVGGSADVLFSDSRSIKITANPQIFAKALYHVGPFQNSGSLPPKSEQETTYTITWTVTNPLNNLSNTQVSAVLPLYTKWLGVVSPSQEKVNYDETTRRVTWNVGNILAGAGAISSARETSFQISFLPSVSQIGTSPSLVGEVAFTAKDNFTLTNVSSVFPAINTRLGNDPYFQVDEETVIQ